MDSVGHEEPTTLREARKASGFTQRALAQMLTIDHSTISKWEAGLSRPPYELQPRLAAALGLPVEVVSSWFADLGFLKGDGVGQVPGLKRLIAESGLSVEAIAKECEVGREVVQGWLHRRRTLQRSAIEPLARLLGLPPSEFLRESRRSSREMRPGQSLLRDARLARRLTQEQLAAQVGVTGATMSHWENGSWMPPAFRVYRLARILGVGPGDLARSLAVSLPHESTGPFKADEFVGAGLQQARLEAGLTRSQFARCVGVRPRTVGGWEEGRTRPRGTHRERVTRVLAPHGTRTNQPTRNL